MEEATMSIVKEILERKGSDIAWVEPGTTVIKALELMAEKNIGAVLVMDDKGIVHGIFSERDFARKIILKGHSCESEPVSEIMTKKVLFVHTDTSLEECMNIMTEQRIRHLPVLENNRVVGVISIGDVVKTLLNAKDRIIAEQAFELGQKERLTQAGAV